jgi:hypothetical protein
MVYGGCLYISSRSSLKEDPVFETLVEFVIIGVGILAIVRNVLLND